MQSVIKCNGKYIYDYKLINILLFIEWKNSNIFYNDAAIHSVHHTWTQNNYQYNICYKINVYYIDFYKTV